MQKELNSTATQTPSLTRQSEGHRNLWETAAIKAPEDPKEDPRGHIAFYRALEMM